MKVLVLGGTGMLGPYVVPTLDSHFDLLVTDIHPPKFTFKGEFRQVDIANAQQVMEAAAGMDAILNLSVLRHDRKLAFDVNTVGCYNMMEAAVAHGIRRVVNTGPHFTISGQTYELFDYGIVPDVPPQPGTNLYALTKSLGHEITRVYTEQYPDLYVQMYLFYNFRNPADLMFERDVIPFAVSWQNGAEVFKPALEIDLARLPSRFEVFHVFGDMPHQQFSNEKVKRIIGWQPKDDISALWDRSRRK
jgi:UDP-glucose 4-epimerase